MAGAFTKNANGTYPARDGSGETIPSANMADPFQGSPFADWMQGVGGNDILNGYGGDDLLEGGQGADMLAGGTGNDWIFADTQAALNPNAVSANYGPEHLIGIRGGAGDDVFLLATGGDTNGLDQYDGGSGVNTIAGGCSYDTLHVSDHLANLRNIQVLDAGDGMWRYNTVVVDGAANGATLDFSAMTVKNFTIAGTAGADVITGTAGNDHIRGGAGNDQLNGGAGDDVYLFGRGDGQDRIYDYDASVGNLDVLSFGPGIAADQLWLSHVGNDLEVSLIGTSDKVAIANWYSGNASHVEQFKTADGKTLLDSQVQSLVQAMASFAPPAAGQMSLPPDYQTALAPLLAANWK